MPQETEHIDELKARRQRRRVQGTASAVNGKPHAPQSAGAARDLLGGLITNGAPRDDDARATSDARDMGASPNDDPNKPDSRAPNRATDANNQSHGEGIDELIRRVKDSAQAMADDAATASLKRRPTGTADLAPDAAPRGHGARRNALRPDESDTATGRSKRTRRWAAAATVLLGGVVILIALSSSNGHRTDARGSSSASIASLQAITSLPDSAAALRAKIAVVSRKLQIAAGRSTPSGSRRRNAAKRRRTSSHPKVRRPQQTPPARENPPVTVSVPHTTATTPIQQSAPALPPTTSTSPTSATADTSRTSNGHPAGPTTSDPLGGLGSCVKGC
jgi:hypothetical protein